MSVLEKWIWNPLTPASVPAGARISAGKSGSVLMSLPISADVSVNCIPANCIPSPESPAKRTVTDGSLWMGFLPGVGGAVADVIAVASGFEEEVLLTLPAVLGVN